MKKIFVIAFRVLLALYVLPLHFLGMMLLTLGNLPALFCKAPSFHMYLSGSSYKH